MRGESGVNEQGRRVKGGRGLLKQVPQKFGTVTTTLHPLRSEEVQKDKGSNSEKQRFEDAG